MSRTARYYRMALSIIAFLGIFLQLGIPRGEFNYTVFLYFTILSNLLVMFFYFFDNIFDRRRFRWLKGAMMMCITVTGLVYHVLLARGPFAMGVERDFLDQGANFILHTLVPVMTVLDWVLFDKKPAFKRTDPFTWCILPDIYLVVFLLRGLIIGTPVFFGGSRYPYFFMDLDKIGVTGFIKYVLFLHIFFIILGFIYYGIDKVLAKYQNSTRI